MKYSLKKSLVLGGCSQLVHGRSRMTIDPHIPTMRGWNMLGFQQPGCCLGWGLGGE